VLGTAKCNVFFPSPLAHMHVCISVCARARVCMRAHAHAYVFCVCARVHVHVYKNVLSITFGHKREMSIMAIFIIYHFC
jgi:hypothetical protein